MTTKSIERKLIYFDEMKYNNQRQGFLDNETYLNEISTLYNELGIGLITHERASQILSFDGDYSEIRRSVHEQVEKGTGNSFLLNLMKKEADDRLDVFEQKTGKLRQRFSFTQRGTMSVITPLDYYALTKEGRFYIAEDTWQRIKDERCSVIISTKEEHAVYDALQKLAAATNEFVTALGPIARGKVFPLRQPSDFLIYTDNGFAPDPRLNLNFLAQ